jgi:hypothetical protein
MCSRAHDLHSLEPVEVTTAFSMHDSRCELSKLVDEFGLRFIRFDAQIPPNVR